MRNRAKCKLCADILESFHATDYVTCGCGEISIDGGAMYLKAAARDWANFMRIDDEGNEIIVKVQDASLPVKEMPSMNKPSHDELMDVFRDMIERYENLPQAALISPITHYDLLSLMLLLNEILKYRS